MDTTLFYALTLFLGVIYLWIGKAASRGQNTCDEYFLMGRNLSFFPLTLTLLATYIGAGTLLGAAQEAYDKGWWVLLYPLGSVLGLFGLAMGFGKKLRDLDISTIAEIFEKIYRSPALRSIASALSIITLFFIFVAQGIAAKQFFLALSSQGGIIFIIFWAVFVSYTVMGGLKAVVNTDILQALFIIFTLIVAYFSLDTTSLSQPQTPFAGESEISQVPWSAWLLMPMLFILIEQDIAQRCFAAKSSKTITYASIAAGCALMLCSGLAIYFGIVAKQYGIIAPEGTSILIEAIKTLTNPWITSLFMVTILVAILSTADSVLCSIGSNISYDFLKFIKTSEKSRVNISRLLTLATGMAALGMTYLFDNVVTVLIGAYEFSVCVIFIPLVAALILKSPSKTGAYFSIATGALGFFLFRMIELPFPKEMFTMSLASIGYLSGKLFETQKTISEVA